MTQKAPKTQHRCARGSDSIHFSTLSFKIDPTFSHTLRSEELSGHSSLTKKSMLLSFRRFWIRSAFMYGAFSCFLHVVQNILRVLKKGNEALRQDLPPKIIPIPTLSTRLHHPHHPSRTAEDTSPTNSGLLINSHPELMTRFCHSENMVSS